MMRRTSEGAALVALACVVAWSAGPSSGLIAQREPVAEPASDGPRYGSGNNLVRPANYRDWMFLSSSLGLSYQPSNGGLPQFQNVFVNRSSYRGFMQTGKWPDKTIFVLEFRKSAAPSSSVNRDGRFQSGLDFIEAEVKDSRFADGWAYYSFDQATPPTGAPPLSGDRVARCIECHTQHTAVERTFVQFYPTLFDVAKQHGTVKPNYTDP